MKKEVSRQMKLASSGYFSRYSHVELGRYFPERDKISRIMADGEPVLIPWSEIGDFAAKYNHLGIYHSIRHYDPSQGGINGPSLAPMHFDVDDKEYPENAYRDTVVLLKYLLEDVKIPSDAIRVYFSGQKGYHLELEPLATRLNLVHEDSALVFRHVAETLKEELNLTSLDFAVYDIRRIWRLAGSKHQATGLWKIPCKDMMLDGETFVSIRKKAETQPTQEELEVPEQEFSPVAARFFSDIVADYEMKKKDREMDKLSNFLSSGHTHTVFSGDVVREFDIKQLRDNCPAVDYIIDKAYTKHTLEHYERLFLCSLLTYTDESIEFLHKTLAECEDYQFEISNLHIQDWIRRREMDIGGRPYTCEKAKTVGIVCSGCEDLQVKSYENSLGAKRIADPSPVRFAYKYHPLKKD